jgi:hypothetical protein
VKHKALKMIKQIIEILNQDDWLVGDKDIDIAKGINEAPLQVSEIKSFYIRNKQANY